MYPVWSFEINKNVILKDHQNRSKTEEALYHLPLFLCPFFGQTLLLCQHSNWKRTSECFLSLGFKRILSAHFHRSVSNLRYCTHYLPLSFLASFAAWSASCFIALLRILASAMTEKSNQAILISLVSTGMKCCCCLDWEYFILCPNFTQISLFLRHQSKSDCRNLRVQKGGKIQRKRKYTSEPSGINFLLKKIHFTMTRFSPSMILVIMVMRFF